MNNVTAIILAGGKGKRMDILCQNRPKPTLPFAGKFRVIDFSLSNCIYSQVSDIAVLTDYQRSQMADYVNRWRLSNANHVDLHILEPRRGSYKGTADAVYQNLGFLKKCNHDAVLVLAADHVYKFDYREMMAFHNITKADVTIGIIPVPKAHAQRFGTVNLDSDNRITDFLEKSAYSWSNLASMGIYIFNRKILEEALIEDAANPTSQHDFGYSIIPEIVKKYRVFAYKFNGYWKDIGTVETYYETNMEMTPPQPQFSLEGTSAILTQEQPFSISCIGNQASVTNSLISPGCVIRGRVENSVISPQVRIEEGAVVKNSIIMANAFIEHDCIIDGCIVDERVKVGAYSYIGLGHEMIQGGGDITILGQGVVIPSHSIVGRNARVLPDSSPSELANGRVMTGEILPGRLVPEIQNKDQSIVKV
jgi:glucose-1-phosphate adenylyltransferase